MTETSGKEDGEGEGEKKDTLTFLASMTKTTTRNTTEKVLGPTCL